jgi:KilA-N domain
MKTMVIMKRSFMDKEISQRSDNEFLSATDLVRVGNLWRLNNNLPAFNLNEYLRRKSTIEFLESLSKEYKEIKINSKGKNSHTWVHPFLFIDIALALNPDFKLSVYKWIYDSLIKYRNDSGDSYKKMTGALWLTIENKSEFTKEIIDIANKIKIECGVIDWQEANETQLKLRDKIHEYVALLSDIIRDRKNLLDVAIKKARNEDVKHL